MVGEGPRGFPWARPPTRATEITRGLCSRLRGWEPLLSPSPIPIPWGLQVSWSIMAWWLVSPVCLGSWEVASSWLEDVFPQQGRAEQNLGRHECPSCSGNPVWLGCHPARYMAKASQSLNIE